MISYDTTFGKYDKLNIYKKISSYTDLQVDGDPISSHYMTVTKVLEINDSVNCAHHTILEVSTVGKKNYIDYDKYAQALNYFTNILYIK